MASKGTTLNFYLFILVYKFMESGAKIDSHVSSIQAGSLESARTQQHAAFIIPQ
jgi:hypothetical protein